MVDLLGNTAVDWFCILSYFRLAKKLQKDAIFGHFEVVYLLGLERLKYGRKEFIVTVNG